MKRPSDGTQGIDLGFLDAATVTLPEHTRLDLFLVGCGGTGSFASRSVAQIARVLGDTGRSVRVTFVDPDTVESVNVPRQSFAECEIGLPKELRVEHSLNRVLDDAAPLDRLELGV